jgi:molybdopterin synthase sulfur carrier subunit
MRINVRYFASLREAIGRSGETLDWPEGDGGAPATVAALRAWLRARGGAYAEVLAAERAVRAALDQTMVADDAALADGAEVAFFPPVTGG